MKVLGFGGERVAHKAVLFGRVIERGFSLVF